MLNVDHIRKDFPILERQVNGHPLVYLDNSATSQKPRVLLHEIVGYYSRHNANVHRGVHTLSDESTDLYDKARSTIANFIHAHNSSELIFVRNTTEAINLVASSWGWENIKAGDEIIVTELEHHSNLLPWQRLCQQKKAHLVICPVDGNGDLATDHLVSLVGDKVKLVCLTQVSNVLGTIVDVQHIIKAIKRTNKQVKILVDGAQAVPHMPVNVVDIGADFYTFSGHKMAGPQGIGCLYVRMEILTTMQPFLVGGGMINEVNETTSTWADVPDRFDAGTPNVVGAVGLATACNYLDSIGMENIYQHEQELTAYAISKFSTLEDQGLITWYGLKDPNKRAGIFTFNIDGVHSHDAAQILDRELGIAIRSGHHCNQILTRKLGVPATLRASVYLYNTKAEIDLLIQGITLVKKIIK